MATCPAPVPGSKDSGLEIRGVGRSPQELWNRARGPGKATQTRPAGVVLGQTLCQVAREIRFPRKVTPSDGKLSSIFLIERDCSFLEGRWPPVQCFVVHREVSRSPCVPRRKPCASGGGPGRLPQQVGGGSPPTYPSLTSVLGPPLGPGRGSSLGPAREAAPSSQLWDQLSTARAAPPLVAARAQMHLDA